MTAIQPRLESLGPYRIEELHRAGGMGEVYRAVDERLARTVALKVLPPHCCDDVDRRRRLREEGRLLSAINHPHICTLFDVGARLDRDRSAGVDFLVMEFIEGQTLDDRLATGRLSVGEAARLASQMARALAAAHRAGIVHRDLKPANIMLTRCPGDPEPQIKLLDFGLACQIGASRKSDGGSSTGTSSSPLETAAVEGTWPYMSPEQLGDGAIDARTDVWGLGIVLYEMVCGRRPFERRPVAALVAEILKSEPAPPSAITPGCSRELSHVIERCLAKDPAKRWPDCHEIAERLEAIALVAAICDARLDPLQEVQIEGDDRSTAVDSDRDRVRDARASDPRYEGLAGSC